MPNQLEGNNCVLETATACLWKYSDLVAAVKREHGMFFNGCKERALDLLKDLIEVGIDGKLLLIEPPDNKLLTHESGTLWNYHFVVEYNGLIFDPNYTGRIPLPLEVYINAAFEYPKEGITVKGFSEQPLQ